MPRYSGVGLPSASTLTVKKDSAKNELCSDEKPLVVSGTEVRERLTSGVRPDPRIMRPETADILIEAYHGSAAGGS